MSRRWIDVPYKCRCMAAEIVVQVKERAHGEDVVDFVERCGRAVGKDHAARSPLCRSATMEYLKLPVPPGGGIGEGQGGTA